MHPDEAAKMKNTGKVQEGGGGQTRVADPANPNTYKRVQRDAPAGGKRELGGCAEILGQAEPVEPGRGRLGVGPADGGAVGVRVPRGNGDGVRAFGGG